MFVQEHGVKQKRSKEFLKFEAELREQEERPIREVEAQLKRTATELAKAERELRRQTIYTEPSPELSTCKQYVPDGSRPEEVSAKIAEAVDAMRLGLDTHGIVLNNPGLIKLGQLLAVNRNLDSRDPATLRACFDLLDSLGEFSDRDVTRRPVVATVKETPSADPLAEMETVDTTTREGNKRAKRLAIEAASIEYAPLFREFIGHMQNMWGLAMGDAQCNAVVEFCQKRGGFGPEILNQARREVLNCWTQSEQNARDLDAEFNNFRTSNPKASEYSLKVELARLRQKYPTNVD